MGDCRIENGVLMEYTGEQRRVRVPHGVRRIETRAFAACKTLEELVLPGSVKEIGHGAFMHCPRLCEILLPRSVKTMGEAVFAGCVSLARAVLPAGLSLLPADTFRGCTALTEVKWPRRLTYIGDRAFADCVSLCRIRLPRGVVRIDIGAFEGCTALSEVRLPATLISIEDDAFKDCAALTSLTLPKGLKLLSSAVEGCSALTELHFLGKGPFDAGIGVFSGAASPLRVTYGGKSEDFEAAVAPSFGPLYHVTMGDFAHGQRFPMFHRTLGKDFVCHVTCLGDGKTLTLHGEPYDQTESYGY